MEKLRAKFEIEGRGKQFLSTNQNVTKWSVISESVVVSKHARSNTPLQDAIKWEEENDNTSIILSVADGHGNPMHFRSAIGAKIAVEIANDTLKHFTKKNSHISKKIF